MTIVLTVQEVDLLRTLLDKELSDIKVEIHHTDNYDFKKQLKEREARIHALLGRIQSTQ